MKKIILLALCSVLVCMLLFPAGSYAGTFIGKFCFKFDAYADTWVWEVTQVNYPGGKAYQVTGYDTVYPAAMDGGGNIVGSSLLLSVTETQKTGRRAIHAIDLNLGTLGGKDWFSWHNPDGTGHVTYSGLGFHQIACPAAGEVFEGAEPPTDSE